MSLSTVNQSHPKSSLSADQKNTHSNESSSIDDIHVADYLANHPDFFKRNPDVIADMAEGMGQEVFNALIQNIKDSFTKMLENAQFMPPDAADAVNKIKNNKFLNQLGILFEENKLVKIKQKQKIE